MAEDQGNVSPPRAGGAPGAGQVREAQAHVPSQGLPRQAGAGGTAGPQPASSVVAVKAASVAETHAREKRNLLVSFAVVALIIVAVAVVVSTHGFGLGTTGAHEPDHAPANVARTR
jgi:nitrate reductase NapE component